MAYTPTQVQKDAARKWCRDRNVTITSDGKAVLYKCVNKSLKSEQSLYGSTKRMTNAYKPGQTLTDPLFQATNNCGKGLHFSPTTNYASGYVYGVKGKRFLKVHVDADKVIGLGSDKCKSESCYVVEEVDRNGQRLVVQPQGVKSAPTKATNRKSGYQFEIGPEKSGVIALHRTEAIGGEVVIKLITKKNLAKSYSLS